MRYVNYSWEFQSDKLVITKIDYLTDEDFTVYDLDVGLEKTLPNGCMILFFEVIIPTILNSDKKDFVRNMKKWFAAGMLKSKRKTEYSGFGDIMDKHFLQTQIYDYMKKPLEEYLAKLTVKSAEEIVKDSDTVAGLI